MKVFEHIYRINLMHKLILNKKTGTPEEFASVLGISRSRLYVIMDELKSQGATITYSKRDSTFYYEHPCDISLKVSMHSLNN